MPFELDTSELFQGQEQVDVNASSEAESDAGTLDVDPPAPAAATAAEPPAGNDEPPEGRKQVPLGALQQERLKRQELQTQLETERQERVKLQSRTDQILQLQIQQMQQATQPTQQEQAIEVPAFEDDPAGHVTGLRLQFERELAQLRQFAQGQQGQQQQANQHQELAQWTTNQEVAFASTVPDYQDAYTHFASFKQAEYAALGLDPATAQQQLMRDYTGLAAMARQQGRNPGEVMYTLAKAFGFKGKQPGANTSTQPPKVPNTSLSTMAGAPEIEETGALTAAKLSNMSDDEFSKMFKEMGRKANHNPRPRV